MQTAAPRILTTTVGSYPVPDWLAALPSEQSLLDATRVVFDLQRQAGIDLPTDGELYRFDVNHPDTNGMIDYFVSRLGGIRYNVGRRDSAAFRAKTEMRFRSKPAGVVVGSCDGRIAEPAGRLRAGRHGRGRAVQVHGDEPLHARPHAARRALSRFPGVSHWPSPTRSPLRPRSWRAPACR